MKKLINNIKNENIELTEEAATSSSDNIQQAFEISIHDGKGFYETGVSTAFWSTLMITAKIFQPETGEWTIKIKDKARKNLVVYENYHVVHDKEISFNYKTSLKVNLLIEATWNQVKDTILSGELSIKY
ncbi:hypothetical protein K2F40_10935 [Clostridium sp. CM028]|uniref:hypothetical protein n=1 Tax=unclassified Clostridium TaxID=2614128 RepID=UPI001C0E8B7C|nr:MULTISPECIES: hypothetical protein [unclassified Clostridium]MBU3092689.1 hypothetical protein [Clostridium sp. CF011]MBW9145625.1 hypothetical protein [Clostridium sp. CM027]MBW9149475.1 hypothetical protein [Clostridium sp. CM028]UVE41521.1 hypothetical protein KTC92_03220 [Clostridium sp. CM027]WAG70521.1 hypothetical protein LL036_03505 [Clostridium sp. CF011]